MTKTRVSADIGGTFTDFVVQKETGEISIGKVPTTTDNPALGVLDGIRSLVDDPGSIDFFVHGTTVGLNAFLQRRGARTLLIMTGGVGDTYTIARGHREELYKLRYRKPKQLLDRESVHEVTERLSWDGSVITDLVESDFAPIIEKAKAQNIEAIAICFLHAYTNPAHELRAREILQEALPEISVSLSHEVAPEWREVERASSTVMDAYVAPVVELYLKTLKSELLAEGMEETIHVMRSNGGVMTDISASKHPISTLLSGPVGGSIGGMQLSAATGLKNLLCVDMGGTSFDLSLVVDGQPQLTSETVLEGLPLLMSIINIETVGAGGGSMAWIENGGLRVGPQSAGSLPGPVCYGRGGTQPTVTDANLFLRRLGDGSLLDGKMTLDSEANNAAMERLAAELGLSDVELAEGILAISNAKMADAMRTITVGQGIDPREYTLVAFGGAGPMHAVELARELDIAKIIIPQFPGTFSAWGMLQSDIRHDLSKSFFRIATELESKNLEPVFDEMRQSGVSILTEENVPTESMAFEQAADLRYSGQEYTISVPIKEGAAIAEVIAEFHKLYEVRYGHALPEAPVEIINLRLAAFGKLEKIPAQKLSERENSDAVSGQRDVIFNGQQHATPIYKRYNLAVGQSFHSPAVIEEESATTIIPPGYHFSLDTFGNIMIEAEEQSR